MTTKLKISAILMMLNLLVFSQTATENNICLPKSTVKLIAIDLAKCDSIKDELTETTSLLNFASQEIRIQQQLVDSYTTKASLYQKEISLYKQKEKEYDTIVLGLEKDVKKAKRNIRLLKVAVGVSTLAATVIFIVR